MFYVYLIKDKNNKLYFGYTSDLKKRLQNHKLGHTRTTKIMKDIELYYYEAYKNEVQARQREKKLKQYGSSYAGLKKV